MRHLHLSLTLSLGLLACGSADAPGPVGRCGDGPVTEGPCHLVDIIQLAENSCAGFGGRDTYNVLFALDGAGRIIVDPGVCLNDEELVAARAHYEGQDATCRHRASAPCPDEVSVSVPLYRPAAP